MLTSDGTPCNQQLTPEQDEIKTGPLLPTLGEPERDQPTAQEIIRTLADDQQAAARARQAVADSRAGPSPGPPRSTPTASRRGASRWRVRPLTAAAVAAAVAAGIVVAIAFRSGSPSDRDAPHIPAAAATTPATHLSASAANIMLELARNTDHNDAARNVRHDEARRAPNRAAARHPSSQHAVSANPTIDTATTPTVTVPAPSAGSGSDQSSTSSTSGYHPTPAVTAPTATQPTTASHSTTSPSKATLRSLIDGAGRCGC
jgi:hypothetical protein